MARRTAPTGPISARRDHVDAFGATMLVTFSVLMGLNQPLIKLVNEAMSPVFQAAMRSAFAVPVVLGYALLMRRRISILDGTFWPGVLAGVIFSMEFAALFVAVELTAVTRTTILLYTMPVWLALAAHFLIPGEALTLRRMLGLGLAFIGMGAAFSERSVDAGPHQLWGDLLCVAAAMLWASLALLLRLSRLSRVAPEMQLLYQLGVSAILLAAIAPLFGDVIRAPTAALGAIFAFQVVVIVSFGFLSWFWVLSVYPASDMASFGFLAPVFGVIFSWLILGETISFSIVGALLLVALGIFLVNWKPRAAPR